MLEWISVEDRKPPIMPDDHWILTYDDVGGHWYTALFSYEGEWVSAEYLPLHFTHWVPLDKPPLD